MTKTYRQGQILKLIRSKRIGTQEELATLMGSAHGVHSLAFSPDGKTLASGSFDKTVKLWIAATDADVERLRR